jgi:tRNA(fMet)-specific endonuclease VapC
MTPDYLLDTNTVSYYIAHNPLRVREELDRIGLDSTAVSAITEAELRYGLAKNPLAARRRASVESFLRNVLVYPWDSAVAQRYGDLRAEQERKGMSLSVEDMMIAAHALALGLTLVTRDGAFSFVEGLRTVDWTV